MIDEAAIMPLAGVIWESIQPTLFTGGRSIIISTPYGTGNFYHDQYTQAIQGKNNMAPIRLDWWMHPDRDQDWYDRQKRALGTRRTAQEIDCEFLSSGHNVFDLARIAIITQSYEALKDLNQIKTFENGDLIQFFAPEAGVEYTLGADIASGRSRDFSAFSIMDPYGKEMACFKGKLGTGPFARLIMKWGRIYNWAMLAPELNGIGEGVVNVCIEEAYPNMFSPEKQFKKDDPDFTIGQVIGWVTSPGNRQGIIDRLNDDLMDCSTLEIFNPFFSAEAESFIYDNSNRPIALGKVYGRKQSGEDLIASELGHTSYTDDAILSVAITNDARKLNKRHNKPVMAVRTRR
jgi:hypothetical protein